MYENLAYMYEIQARLLWYLSASVMFTDDLF
jgi:hypothetical protein